MNAIEPRGPISLNDETHPSVNGLLTSRLGVTINNTEHDSVCRPHCLQCTIEGNDAVNWENSSQSTAKGI